MSTKLRFYLGVLIIIRTQIQIQCRIYIRILILKSDIWSSSRDVTLSMFSSIRNQNNLERQIKQKYKVTKRWFHVGEKETVYYIADFLIPISNLKSIYS